MQHSRTVRRWYLRRRRRWASAPLAPRVVAAWFVGPRVEHLGHTMDSLPPSAKLMAYLEDESCLMPGGSSDGKVCNVSPVVWFGHMPEIVCGSSAAFCLWQHSVWCRRVFPNLPVRLLPPPDARPGE